MCRLCFAALTASVMTAGVVLKSAAADLSEIPASRADRIALTMAQRSRSLHGSMESVTISRKSWPLVRLSYDGILCQRLALPEAKQSMCMVPRLKEGLFLIAQGTQEIDPSEITICQHDDGRLWLLGSGSFGQVRVCLACVVWVQFAVLRL